MDNKILSLKEKFVSELDKIDNLADIESIRVSYLGKKGSVTDLLKGMKELSNDERKAFGQKVNELKGLVNEKITEKTNELKEKEIQKEIELMPEFDLSMPPVMDRGSYHPITLVQRECERIFKSMGFTVEDYSEIVTDYECFESLNIPKHHPARDMQDTYYLTNGQLLKSQTSAAQNAIYKKYRDALVNDGVPIKAIFPGRCFRNEATDACHENTFFQMEGVMVDKNISISNLIYFMKTMLSEVFQKDIKVRLRPGFFPFVEPGFELDISCLICGGEGCPSCKHSGWLELCPCGMIHPEVLKAGGIDPDEYTGFAFGLGLTRLVMMKYGIKDIRDFRRQIGISLFDRIGFADFVIVCRPGQSGCLQQLIQRVSFSSEFVDECSFFALSCAANFSCLKAIRFFITSFSALIYSFSVLKRISSSRSDSVKGNGFVDFFILGSFVGRPFLLSTNPLYPCNLYLCTH